MNYINSSASHWFVFCEALYLFRLLRAKAYKDRVRWYILTGWRKFRYDILVIRMISSFVFSSGTAHLNVGHLRNAIPIKNEFIHVLVRTFASRLDSSRTKCYSSIGKEKHERKTFFISTLFFDLVQRHYFHLHLRFTRKKTEQNVSNSSVFRSTTF